MNASAPNPQNQAADPSASCFLTANAGSGKTSTLVNRVARLLLNGAKPEHILCVTYTKAAAAEMQARLFERLGGWAVAKDDDLARQLGDIDEATNDLPRARALFARALETPGGLKIQTIHAFCEKLLRRFPLEAGLSPAFQVLDDLKGHEISEAATTSVLTLDGPGLADVTAVRNRLIVRLRTAGFEKLLGQFVAQHDEIAEVFATMQSRHADWRTALFQALGVDKPCTVSERLSIFCESIEWQIIKDLGSALTAGRTATNQKAGAAFFHVHTTFHATGELDFTALKAIFLTQKDEPRKNPFTAETPASDRIILDRLGREVTALAETLKAIDIATNTLDALTLFIVFSAFYTARKTAEGALNFQDLINNTKRLLGRDLMSAWVLYKLDGGLEHILVDEAQDTSEDQWAIVNALSADFFSGHGQYGTDRTLFAVGDEKQSIYGFQGADPAEFLNTRQTIGNRIVAAGKPLVEPSLTQSWRSLPEILEFVDAVFAAPDLSEALNFVGDEVIHEARRTEGRACVELWPLVQPIDAPETTADDSDDVAAVDTPGLAHPARRLARQLAATVRAEIDAGRSVWTRGKDPVQRPLHAGDVLILVRKRDLLFEHIIRELKFAGVPVSGADRLKLGEHIAFQDLRGLMRFCLYPGDDLSLACVLRSPLCDVSEDDLFNLSHGRKSSLWQALLDVRGEEGPFAEARVLLLWAQRASAHLTAFDFLARVLNRRDTAGRSLKQRFLTRLGDECEDVLDETLALALKGEGAGITGLSACLNLFEFNASEIKREQEEGGRAVRVMTVHGSKGLEAPWVILPIGPQHRSTRREDLLLTSGDGNLFMCAGGKAGETAGILSLRAAKARKDEQEALRLFYVACTRARDRLTVCGYAGKKAVPQGAFPAWYDLAGDAFGRLDDVQSEVMQLKAPFDEVEQAREAWVQLYGTRSALLSAEALHRAPTVDLPDFVTAPVAQADVDFERWQAISQMGDEDRDAAEPSPSPLEASGGLGRYRRGNLIHKLFEILPDVAQDSRDMVARRFLDRQGDLSDHQRDEMRAAVMAVLDDARFAEAFGEHSRPEVALAGRVGVTAKGEAVMLSGRIDRLVVMPDRVLIIDYKSNRPAPDRAEDAAVSYQRQMAGYVALLRQIYPDRLVESALLWTDGPKLTPLSETLVNLRLAEIAAR